MLTRGAFNVVVDGQWGSCGKGLINSSLAERFRPEIISSTNMANAGHTAVSPTDDRFVAKVLPTSAILQRWGYYYNPSVFIGATAAFTIPQLLKEFGETGCESRTRIHPRAGVITEEHQAAENVDPERSTKHIASTMQGCGVFLAQKVNRVPNLRLARDYPELNNRFVDPDFTALLLNRLQHGETILHEGSQGFSLGINHGSHYPHCTSRECTATQMLADMGVPAQKLGQVIMVIRPFPIRVGNVIEEGEMKGYSGGAYEGQAELSWEEVAKRAGAPAEVMKGELTTVTQRLRRVFEFSIEQVRIAAQINGATHIALNFANYIDWSVFGQSVWSHLTPRVRAFMSYLEEQLEIPVSIVGTGPRITQVCYHPAYQFGA